MKNLYSKELYRLMEDQYRKHGASCNAAQLELRSRKLNKMIIKCGEVAVRCLLLHDFDLYHNTDVSDIKMRIEDGEIKF